YASKRTACSTTGSLSRTETLPYRCFSSGRRELHSSPRTTSFHSRFQFCLRPTPLWLVYDLLLSFSELSSPPSLLRSTAPTSGKLDGHSWYLIYALSSSTVMI